MRRQASSGEAAKSFSLVKKSKTGCKSVGSNRGENILGIKKASLAKWGSAKPLDFKKFTVDRIRSRLPGDGFARSLGSASAKPIDLRYLRLSRYEVRNLSRRAG